jgi:hypothetical protein
MQDSEKGLKQTETDCFIFVKTTTHTELQVLNLHTERKLGGGEAGHAQFGQSYNEALCCF